MIDLLVKIAAIALGCYISTFITSLDTMTTITVFVSVTGAHVGEYMIRKVKR